MNSRMIAAALLPILLLTGGCWDQVELTERGFVMGVAIDLAANGGIELTAQIYKPQQKAGVGSSNQGQPYANITTVNSNIFESVRDIPTHLGRRAQWSHQRVILIGEDFAKKHNISEALDFFNRDHEPRQTSKIFITKGKANQFFKKKPLIENTISQQLKRIQESTAKYSAKSMNVNLFMLNLQLESQTGFAAVPYISPDNSQDQSIALKGLALLKNGKMIGALSPIQTEHLNILLNKYKNSIIEIPCEQQVGGNHPLDESLEVVSLQTKIKPKASMESIRVHIAVQIKSSAGELLCSDLSTTKGEKKFIEKVQLLVEQELRALTDQLQARKIDMLGIGNQIYQMNPRLWRSLKPNWDDHFQRAHFTYDIRISLIDTGMLIGKSSVSK
ncbi:Spore germination protein B3 [Paenibacillus plantiphilus]|uniref:Spore germination protein B3 n=1 Tax=Paenibacillus plantiphilus TaxID=2905650 RepID=A0ABM9CVI9_9BACL|nr:Ger(x)C family spore germination protein [Paenibacillus plantiphilus]CAH1224946.1 Spore germination protein B3 [Paenibacillus plantiphilus]